MSPVSVRDTLRLALPPGTTLVAGGSGLSHQVAWVVSARASAPVFVHLRGGELALISVAALAEIDGQLTLANLVERLSRVPIAAIAALGEISEAARAAADTAHLPLLKLPETADLREVEREIQRLISDYEAQLERRGAQLAHALTQRSLAGAGLQGLVETLAERTGQQIACYSAAGELRAIKARGAPRVALQTLQALIPGHTIQLGQTIWIQPLGAGGERLGYLALCGDALDDWDRAAAYHGATALALELAKEHAVHAAEERLRGDFVRSVLAGPATDNGALQQRGIELGYNLRQPHVAMLCSVGTSDESLASRMANSVIGALNVLGINAPTMRRADGLLCFVPISERSKSAREVAEQLLQRVASEVPSAVLALGREAPTVALWHRSLLEAEQALGLGRQLLSTQQIVDFNDLGIYRLLVLLRESPELWDFYSTTLAALADYDRKQGAELIRTLETFFASLGNLARTAEALHVHRNTLLYRLERVREISGLDLEDAEDRLALWLALKIHRILHMMEDLV